MGAARNECVVGLDIRRESGRNAIKEAKGLLHVSFAAVHSNESVVGDDINGNLKLGHLVQ